MPRLSLTLHLDEKAIEVNGLLDTGAAINVLPYWAGLALGANWEAQNFPVQLVGNLGRFEARALVVFASHPQFTPNILVRQVFAWVKTDDAPVIFGQMNFFAEFDVCFYRSQNSFEVHLKSV